MKKEQISGVLVFVGIFIFSLFLMIEEALYKGYSISGNAISDLGVGSTALLFNGTIILMGITLVLAGILLLLSNKKSAFAYLIAIAGVGAMIVGSFPETTGTPHTIGAFIAFAFSGLAAVAGVVRFKSAFRIISPLIGILVLASLVMFATGNYLGLGEGGMERMVVYPALFWGFGVGVYLMGES